MAAEVAQDQLGHRLLAGELVLVGGWHSPREQCVGVLLAAAGTAADELLELGVHEQVAQPQAVSVDAAAAQTFGEFAAGQRLAVERLGQQRIATGQHPLVEAEPGIPVTVEPVDSRPGQAQQPPALGQRPLRFRELLRLIGPQPANGRRGSIERLTGEALTEPAADAP